MLDSLLQLPGTRSNAPADAATIDATQAALGLTLPEPYRQLLLVANGLELLDGHLRLLGTDDLLRWNDIDTWKHAWPHPPVDFVCFGGTSVGDQWAWRITDLRIGSDSAVTGLDSFELGETFLAASTASFLGEVLPGFATVQLDDLVAWAHKRLGSVPKGSLLIAVPPPQFGVEGIVERMRLMGDALVMTAMGDVARQLQGQEGRRVTRFDTVIDDHGRPRLKLIFE